MTFDPRHQSPRTNFLIRVDLPLPDLPTITALELFLLLVRFHISKKSKLPRASLPSIMASPSSCKF